ncbi:MAG: hypothetical protein KIT34_09350 [Cyanobacteria bacterium TGS_CYA1]|nr:hypothetical protein [Cyanobacteria bacterium TGS_CYA1]
MTPPKDFFEKLTFIRSVKAPILVASLIWSILALTFCLAIAAQDVVRTEKLTEATFLLGVSTFILSVGLVILLYQVRRLHKKLNAVAELLEEMNKEKEV